MTLALYGKSHRRQAFLVLFAITALAAATFAGSVMSGDRARATNMPDLVVTKTNDTPNGQVAAGGAFTWTLTITNQGTGPAEFAFQDWILIDDLPAAGSYVIDSRFASISMSQGTIDCGLSGVMVQCKAAGLPSTTIAAGESFAVDVDVIAPQELQVLSNPPDGDRCEVDNTGLIDESNDSNNDCNDGNADTVQVVESLDVEQEPLLVTKTGDGTYLESHSWIVTKSVVGEADKSAGAGQTADFDFDIDVTRETSYTDITASGDIAIANPPNNTENAILSGVTDHTAGMTITGCDGAGSADGDDWQFDPALELAPDSYVTCDWEYDQAAAQVPPAAIENTATVDVTSSSPVEGASGTHTVTFKGSTDPDAPGQVDLVDTFITSETAASFETLATVEGSTSIPYSSQVTCPPAGDNDFYGASGGSTVAITGTNTAALEHAGTEFASDAASFSLDCTRSELTLEKEVDSTRDPSSTTPSGGDWTLTAAHAGENVSGASGASGHVAPGDLVTLSESGPEDYSLASLTCVLDGDPNGAFNVSPGSPAFRMPDGDTTCTFKNEFTAPTLTLEKVINRAGDDADDGQFRISATQDGADVVSATGTDTVAEDDAVDFASDTVAIQAGETVSLSDTFVSGSASGIGDYSARATCYRNGNIMSFNPLAHGFTPQPGDDYVCTIENTRRTIGITITKETVDADGNATSADIDFPFTSTEGGFSLNPDGKDTQSFTVPAGSAFEFAEDLSNLPGWQFDSVSCSGVGENVDGTTVSFAVPAGTDVTCDVTNVYRPGTLEITKEVEWGDVTPDTSASFQLCIEGLSHPDGDCRTTDHDGGTYTWNDLLPGDYTVTEPGVDSSLWSVSGSGSQVTVEGGDTATHTVTNTRLSGDITVSKTVNANGGDAGDWSFEVCVFEGTDTAVNPVGCVDLDESAPTKSVENLAPGTYTVAETPDDDYTTSVRVNGGEAIESTGAEIEVTGEDPVNVEFTNTLKPGQLTVEKRYGASFDTATCDAPAEADWPAVTLGDNALSGDGCQWGPVDVGANVDHEVDEVPADGWTPAGLEYTEECRVGFTGEASIDTVLRLVDQVPGVDAGALLGSTLTINVRPGESCTVSYLNEPVGDVVILKVDEVPTDTAQDWTFSDGGAPSGHLVLTTPANPAGTAVAESIMLEGVPTAEGLAIGEVEGAGQCTVDSTETGYQTHALVTYGEEPSETELAGAPLVADGQVTYDVRKGETTYIAFANRGCGNVLSSANLFVEKFASRDGSFAGDEPLAGWSITATGTGGLAEGFEGTLETDSSGMAGFPGVPTGTYTICETPRDGYEVVGSAGDDGQGEVAGECRTGVEVMADGADINTSIQFFNQPVGDVRVEVRTLEDGEPVDERGGWTISVAGCGYAGTASTGEDGVALFEGIPACDALSVTQDPDSKPGFAATSGDSRSVSLEAGQTAEVTFTNEAFTGGNIPDGPTATPTPGASPTPDPDETPTPDSDGENWTATPAPTEPATEPTATTATPTVTPTPVDDVAGEQTPGPGAPSSTPTPVDDVAGEQTPGPGDATSTPTPDSDESAVSATPIPPDSGTGHASADGATLMAALGALALLAGIGSLTLARRRR